MNDQQPMLREEYYSARQKVEKLFTSEFFEKYYIKDATFRAAFEGIVRGHDPYRIIEELIKNRQELVDTVNNLTVSMSPSSFAFYKANFLNKTTNG